MEIKKFSLTNHFVKALVYGASGCGKTTFAGTAHNAIFASAEAGLMSIAHLKPAFVDIRTVDDLKNLLTYLKTQKHSYEAVVIDSISEINEIIKASIEQKSGKSMQLQDWAVVQRTLRAIFRGFRELPMHVLFLAQENMEMDDQKISKIVPALNGKAADEIAYFMDIVGYLRIDPDGTRHMVTEPNARYLTKDRSRVIGNDTPVDFGVWMEKISKLEVSEQEVAETFEPPAPEPKPSKSPSKSLAVKCPPEAGDLGRSNEQASEILSLWSELMNLKDVALEKRGSILELQLRQDYGAKSVNYLRNKQAAHMLDQLIDAIKAEKAKIKQLETPEPSVEMPQTTEQEIADAERGGMQAA